MKLYLAGPMTGIPEYNFPAFDMAAIRLRVYGHEVFNPAENDRSKGFDATGLTGYEQGHTIAFDLRSALKDDLSWICDHAEGLVVLPDAERSMGVAAEIALARALRIPVTSLETMIAFSGQLLSNGASIG